jgi:hypothetical protein
MPDLASFNVGRHTRGDAIGHKAERPMIRVIPKSEFTVLNNIENVLSALFGLSV